MYNDVYDYDSLRDGVLAIIFKSNNSRGQFTRASVLRYVADRNISARDAWRRLFLHGFYDVHYRVHCGSAPFFLATKPWRPITLLQPTANIDVCVNGNLKKTKKVVKRSIPVWNHITSKTETDLTAPGKILALLTSDRAIATAIQSLTLTEQEVEFRQLHVILKRLPNIKLLRVDQFDASVSTEEMCHSLNQLPRLRHLHIDYPYRHRYPENSTPSATVLFNRLNHGCILMPESKSLNIGRESFAYKSIIIHYSDASPFSYNLSDFFQLCTRLAYVTITGYHVPRHNGIVCLTIPPSVVSLKLSMLSAATPTRIDVAQSILGRLELEFTSLDWLQMTAQYPQIRHLGLRFVSIQGNITGIRLITLRLEYTSVDEARKPIVRRMCKNTLSHLSICNMKVDLELKDWAVHPAFLSRCYVHLGKYITRRFSETRRVELFCHTVIWNMINT